jgi:hypothetical protein
MDAPERPDLENLLKELSKAWDAMERGQLVRVVCNVEGQDHASATDVANLLTWLNRLLRALTGQMPGIERTSREYSEHLAKSHRRPEPAPVVGAGMSVGGWVPVHDLRYKERTWRPEVRLVEARQGSLDFLLRLYAASPHAVGLFLELVPLICGVALVRKRKTGRSRKEKSADLLKAEEARARLAELLDKERRKVVSDLKDVNWKSFEGALEGVIKAVRLGKLSVRSVTHA